MFEQTFVTDGKTKRERTIALALILQTLGITGLALLPLLTTESIGAGKRVQLLPPAFAKPEPPKVKQAAASGPRSNTPSLRVVQLESLTHRFVPPTHVSPLQPGDAPILGTESGSNAGIFAGDFLGTLNTGTIQPPRAPAIPKAPRQPVRVSSGITQSLLILGPKPAYPKLALAARIAATVRLQATISREGRIEHLHVLSGHPLLNDAAMDAVRQWRYRPLLLNGDPVEVITEIDVNFTLNQ